MRVYILLSAMLITTAAAFSQTVDLSAGDAISGEWRVEGGVLVGDAGVGTTAWWRVPVAGEGLHRPEMVTISLAFRTPEPANGGVVFLGHLLPVDPAQGAKPRTVRGLQANIETRTPGATGAIIEEGGRGVLVKTPPAAAEALDATGWNRMTITTGNGVTSVTVNDVPASKLFDENYIDGDIYLQVAAGAGSAAEVQYKDISVKATPARDPWRPLFDGKSLDGWKEWGSEEWTVSDGAIHGRRGPKESEGYLATVETFEDFHVRGAFKMLGEGNYGLFFHSTITLRDDGYPVIAGVQGEVEPNYPGTTGGLYESYQRGWIARPEPNSLAAYALKPGEWNTIEIRSRGNQVTTWVNGLRTVDFTDPEPRLFRGSFALQLHTGAGAGIDWKDLYVLDK